MKNILQGTKKSCTTREPLHNIAHVHGSNRKNLLHSLHPPSAYGTITSFFCNPVEFKKRFEHLTFCWISTSCKWLETESYVTFMNVECMYSLYLKNIYICSRLAVISKVLLETDIWIVSIWWPNVLSALLRPHGCNSNLISFNPNILGLDPWTFFNYMGLPTCINHLLLLTSKSKFKSYAI